jgi:galactokinase
MGEEIVDKQQLLEVFASHFGGDTPPRLARAPGRVNLIGEHTDYNDGFVLPMAIDCALWLAVRPRSDRQVILYSLNFAEMAAFSLDDIRPSAERSWNDYVRGVAWALEEQGYQLTGMEGVVAGDVPIGAGLSSSAAIEVATAQAFQLVSGFEWDGVTVALACQRAENEFVGMQCGIMDQFIVALARKDHALLIDCRSLEYELVPLPAGARIVVSDTMKSRELVGSEYNLRRQQCEEGVRLLGQRWPAIKALRDVSLEQFEQCEGQLPDVVRRRCRHIISENERVLASVAALKQGHLAHFGRLMDASHISLRDDYEVSCRELDVITDIARAIEGCLGSRMTGAGFGGCAVSLVRNETVERFKEHLEKEYEGETGLRPRVYVCTASQGAGEVAVGVWNSQAGQGVV